MVMKSFLFLLFYIIASACHSQNLEIQLKAELREEYVYFKIDGNRVKVNVPYLLVKYKNLGKEAIYFKKILNEGVISFPGKERLFHTLNGLREGKQYFEIFTNPPETKFSITISNSDQEYFIKNHSLLPLNLYNIEIHGDPDPLFFEQVGLLKEIIVSQYNLDTNKQLAFFDYPQKEIVPYIGHYADTSIEGHKVAVDENDFPIDQYKNQFIFLKRNEEYTQRLNLLPLLLLGGNYCFSLAHYRFENCIKLYNSGIDDSLKPYFSKLKFPEKFGEYYLYTDEYISNDTCIKFNNQKGMLILGIKKYAKN